MLTIIFSTDSKMLPVLYFIAVLHVRCKVICKVKIGHKNVFSEISLEITHLACKSASASAATGSLAVALLVPIAPPVCGSPVN